jgi:HEAT repeat protein
LSQPFAAQLLPCLSRVFPSLLVMLLLAGPALGQEDDARQESRAAIDAALASRQLESALKAYDRAAAAEPSQKLLAPIARATLEQALAEGKSWNRVAAARLLAELGDKKGKAALTSELRGAHSQVRARVAQLVADAGLTEALPDLERGVKGQHGSSATERVQMARALHRLGNAGLARQVLFKLAGDADPRNQAQALQALVELEDSESLEVFRGHLAHENRTVALWAARGAARLGDVAAREQLLGWVTAGPGDLKPLAAWYLVAAGFTDFVPAAAQVAEAALARPEDGRLGMGRAVYTLSWMDPAAGQPYLDRLMELEKHINVRILGARRLTEMRHAKALPEIVKLYGEAQHPAASPQRSDLVRLSGWLEDSPELRSFLEQAISDESERVRLTVLETMAALGLEGALPPLRDLLEASDLAVRVPAAAAILHFGDGPGELRPLWQDGSDLAPGW